METHVSAFLLTWSEHDIDIFLGWGDEYFSVTNWTRGLTYMADHVSRWRVHPISSMLTILKGKSLAQPHVNVPQK